MEERVPEERERRRSSKEKSRSIAAPALGGD
jgi:hypothetical protein